MAKVDPKAISAKLLLAAVNRQGIMLTAEETEAVYLRIMDGKGESQTMRCRSAELTIERRRIGELLSERKAGE